jgi:hypothetical protein
LQLNISWCVVAVGQLCEIGLVLHATRGVKQHLRNQSRDTVIISKSGVKEAGDAEISLGGMSFMRFKSIRGRSITTVAKVSSEDFLQSCGLTRLVSLPSLA